MRSNLAFIANRIGQNLDESGTEITLHWDEVTGGTLDRTTGSMVGGTVTAKTATIRAFVHFPSLNTMALREFQEIETGDAILDVAPDVVLEAAGRRNLRFEFNGARWEQKPLSDALAKTWDAMVQGARLHRSVLVRKVA